MTLHVFSMNHCMSLNDHIIPLAPGMWFRVASHLGILYHELKRKLNHETKTHEGAPNNEPTTTIKPPSNPTTNETIAKSKQPSMRKMEKKLRSPVGDRCECVRSIPRPMSTGHMNRSKEPLSPFKSRHYSHK